MRWPTYNPEATRNAAAALSALGEALGGTPAGGLGRFSLTHGAESCEVHLISNGDAERFGIGTWGESGGIAAVGIRLDGPRIELEETAERPYSPFLVVWRVGAACTDRYANHTPQLRPAQRELIQIIQAALTG